MGRMSSNESLELVVSSGINYFRFLIVTPITLISSYASPTLCAPSPSIGWCTLGMGALRTMSLMTHSQLLEGFKCESK